LRPLLVNLSDETDPATSVRMLRQYSVDGVIVASSTLPPSFARAFADAGVPVVHSFGRPSATTDVHVVGIDNVECGRIAARSLVARGYRRLAFLGGPETATSTQDRLAGFLEETARHAGLDVSYSFATAYSFDAGRAEMQHLMPTGLAEVYFCGDDVLSIGAMSVLDDAGLNVPDDVGIIGLNDMEMARWENINLTTIRQPVSEIINSSIELVVATLEKPGGFPEARLFPCQVVERGTLRPMPGISRGTLAALHRPTRPLPCPRP
jgi:DNA-binding LacI/PurR family transcriptional regulator